MPGTSDTRVRNGRAIVATIVCACFLFQQLFVLVHLARDDHHYPGELGERVLSHARHTHGHGGHDHHHDAPDSQPSDDDHRPHSAVDHQVRIAPRSSSLEPADVDLAFARPAPGPAPVGERSVPGRLDGPACPRPPPRPDGAAPRAPPPVS